MSLPIPGRVLMLMAVLYIVLLPVPGCKGKPGSFSRDPGKTASHSIDSLFINARGMIDSGNKNPGRKEISSKAFQLVRQIETLAGSSGYITDSVAALISAEAWLRLHTGDTLGAKSRLAIAREIVRSSGNNKSLAAAYRDEAYFFSNGRKDSLRVSLLYDSAATLSIESGDTLNYFNARFRKAWYHRNAGWDESFLAQLLALIAFQRRDFRVNISQVAYGIAGHFLRAKNDTTAFRYYLEAIENLPNDNSRYYHHALYYEQAGYLYYDMGNYQKARECFEKSLQLASEPGYQSAERASTAISWIEACFKVEGQYRKGIEYLLRLNSLYPPVDNDGKVRLAHNMLELYMMDGQYNQADAYAAALMDYERRGMVSKLNLQFTYELVGKLYSMTGRLADARTQLLKAQKLAMQDNDLRSLAEDSRLLFVVDSTAGNHLEAIRWLQVAEGYQDLRRSRSKIRELRELDVKYSTEKRIDSLKTLTETTRLQQDLIHQTGSVRNGFVAIAILLLIILGILVSRYRLKQRVNNKLQLAQEKVNQQNRSLEQMIAESREMVMEKTNLLAEKTQLLAEKEWLVKEIHHRVKNNFHMISSLMEIQTSYLKSEDALSAIRETQNRIQSMSIIHQKLYQSDTISIINMQDYIYELVEYLRESYGIREDIIFTLDVKNVELNHSLATSIGLILNEAITNAIKYAFPDTSEGRIVISLSHMSDAQLLLVIGDNGVGLGSSSGKAPGGSMGMELLQGLAGDINGTLSVENNKGTQIRILFRYLPDETAGIPFRT